MLINSPETSKMFPYTTSSTSQNNRGSATVAACFCPFILGILIFSIIIVFGLPWVIFIYVIPLLWFLGFGLWHFFRKFSATSQYLLRLRCPNCRIATLEEGKLEVEGQIFFRGRGPLSEKQLDGTEIVAFACPNCGHLELRLDLQNHQNSEFTY